MCIRDSYYDGNDFHLVRKHETERVSYARSFVEFEDGEIKIGAFNELMRIPNEFPDEPYTVQPESKASDAVLLDRDRQLWCGFEDGALRRVDRTIQRVYSIPDGSCRHLYSVGNYIWFLEVNPRVGSERKWSVVRFDKTTQKTTHYPVVVDGSNEPLTVTNLLATASGVWVGTKTHGVYQLVDDKWQHLALPTKSFSETASLMEDSKKRLWIVTRRRLFRVEDGEVSLCQPADRPFSADLCHIVEAPNGDFAIGTTEGIFVVDDNMQEVTRHQEYTGLISNVPRAITYGDDGTLWVATFAGLQSIRGNSMKRYDTVDGMLDDAPDWFVSIWDDEVWCGSNAGINRISLKGDAEVVQHLLGDDGHGWNKILGVAPDGDSMWLGGDEGIWRYRRGKNPPRLQIADVFTTESLGPQEQVSVTTDVKSMRLRFHATSLKNRHGRMIYQYKLNDTEEWTRTLDREIKLPLPSSGKYQLALRAIDRDLLTSDTKRISINVQPPYGRIAKNLALILAVGASLILGILYFARTQQEKSALEQNVKEQNAQLSDLERQLQHAQKMKALGTLASGVAHDFNNSLLAINGNAELALLSDTSEEKDQLISEVLAVTDQAAGLTHSMLMFGGNTASEKRNVDIRLPVFAAEKMLRRTLPASIEFQCDVADEPIYCEADASQIQQVVVNLSLNAKDAMPGGGRLSVTLKQHGEDARLTVRDNGHGMSDETRERIFEPFYTEKSRTKGTGLGLSVVHAIVNDHGGEIRVDSTLNKGTEFQIRLSARPSGTSTPSEEQTSLTKSNGKVLLADDEVQVRSMLAKALLRAGFDVEIAGDGVEFVKQFGKTNNFDLVIVDVDMPGKDGWESLKEVRKKRTNLAAIVISGLPNQQRRFDERTTFIQKPFSLRELTDKATSMIRD